VDVSGRLLLTFECVVLKRIQCGTGNKVHISSIPNVDMVNNIEDI
jgi:hypothetical protein